MAANDFNEKSVGLPANIGAHGANYNSCEQWAADTCLTARP